MSTMAQYRVGDLAPESRALVETLVGRGLGDEAQVKLVVTEPESEEAPEVDEGERQRRARVRLMEELETLPVFNPDDQLGARDIDRIIYGVDQ